MYIHIGDDIGVLTRKVIGIFRRGRRGIKYGREIKQGIFERINYTVL